MKALVFDNELKLVDNYEKPIPQAGEALVRVTMAGICNTDYEITKGYMGYVGILGHAGICNTDYEITKGYMGYVGILGHEAVGVVEDVNINCHSEANKQEILRSAQNDTKAEESSNRANFKHPLIGKRVVPEM